MRAQPIGQLLGLEGVQGPEPQPLAVINIEQRPVRAGATQGSAQSEPLGAIYLGDRDFVRMRSPRRGSSREVPCRQREPIQTAFEQLLRRRSEDALVCTYREGYSLRELAGVLGVHYSIPSS